MSWSKAKKKESLPSFFYRVFEGSDGWRFRFINRRRRLRKLQSSGGTRRGFLLFFFLLLSFLFFSFVHRCHLHHHHHRRRRRHHRRRLEIGALHRRQRDRPCESLAFFLFLRNETKEPKQQRKVGSFQKRPRTRNTHSFRGMSVGPKKKRKKITFLDDIPTSSKRSAKENGLLVWKLTVNSRGRLCSHSDDCLRLVTTPQSLK